VTQVGRYSDRYDHNSWYAFREYGFSPRFSAFELELLVGAGAVSNPGARLGHWFQFTEELNLYYDNIGIGYKHISNAGIKKPNLGRDSFLLRFRIDF